MDNGSSDTSSSENLIRYPVEFPEATATQMLGRVLAKLSQVESSVIAAMTRVEVMVASYKPPGVPTLTVTGPALLPSEPGAPAENSDPEPAVARCCGHRIAEHTHLGRNAKGAWVQGCQAAGCRCKVTRPDPVTPA